MSGARTAEANQEGGRDKADGNYQADDDADYDEFEGAEVHAGLSFQ
jgi:hypothetical protein